MRRYVCLLLFYVRKYIFFSFGKTTKKVIYLFFFGEENKDMIRYMYGKRPICRTCTYRRQSILFLANLTKDTCILMCIYVEWDGQILKDAWIYEEWSENMKKGKHMNRKRPTYITRDNVWKETQMCGKRPIYMKWDLRVGKETYIYEKRPTYLNWDLHMWTVTCV